MIADTIVIILMIAQPSKIQGSGQLNDDLLKSDKAFEQEYKLEIEKMKRASREAAKEAFIETWKELKKKLKK